MLGSDWFARKKLWEIGEFRRWWTDDWSWEGLAKKGVRSRLGAGRASAPGSLQGLWADEADSLIEFAGRRWTRFHLPPFDRSGNPCPADVWQAAKNSQLIQDIRALCLTERVYSQFLNKFVEFEPINPPPDLGGIVFPEEFSFGGGDSALTVLFADFSNTIFLGEIVWHSEAAVAFKSAMLCADVEFSGARFLVNADFTECLFRQSADFRDGKFLESALFNFARFRGRANFRNAGFDADVGFRGAVFGKVAMFAGAEPIAGTAIFRGAYFRGDADFSNRVFENSTSFTDTSFDGVPRFYGARFHSDTYFTGANFHKGAGSRQTTWFRSWRMRDRVGLVLHWPDHHSPAFVDWVERVQIRTFWIYSHLALGLADLPILLSLRWGGMSEIRRARDRRTTRYENAYRNLRLLCRGIGNYEYELMFHALELQAHRSRTDARVLDRLASFLYERMSDYGRSMFRPVAWLAAVWFVVFFIYLFQFLPPYTDDAPGLPPGTCAATGVPKFSALVAAVGRQFLPALFGSGMGGNTPPDWLRCAATAEPFEFFFVGMFQSIVFVTCVTLFLIALRRRFRIQD